MAISKRLSKYMVRRAEVCRASAGFAERPRNSSSHPHSRRFEALELEGMPEMSQMCYPPKAIFVTDFLLQKTRIDAIFGPKKLVMD